MPFQAFKPIPTRGEPASIGTIPILGHEASNIETEALRGGVVVIKRDLVTPPSLGEDWAIGTITLQMFLAYEQSFTAFDKVALELLEAQVKLAQEATEKSTAGKEQVEAAIIREGFKRELADFEVARARENILSSSPIQISARIIQAGAIFWQQRIATERFPVEYHPPTISFANGTTVKAEFVEKAEIFEPLPQPLPLSRGENLQLEMVFEGAPWQGAKTEGTKIEEPVRVAVPRAEVGYEPKPIGYQG